MNALETKEIRQLLPAGGAALLLAVAPVWFMQGQVYNPATTTALYSICLGALLLALSTFGREFGMKTFPLLLAQPLERRRIWRVKITTLSAALGMVFIAWFLACVNWLHDWRGEPLWQQVVPVGATATVAIFAGGLWTTLLLRHMAGAFWLTALIPIGVGVALEPGSVHGGMFHTVLLLYSAAGFIFAWWQFFHAQEVGWTGGTVALPGWRSSNETGLIVRSRRPLATLLRKEIRLNAVGLAGMAAFFVLHVLAVLMRERNPLEPTNSWRTTLEFVGGLWVFAPLFFCASSVAEERRLGTLDSQLCLPVSSRVQYTIKLLFVLVLGGLLSALLLWIAEGIGSVIGAPSGLGELGMFPGLKSPFNQGALFHLCVLFTGMVLVGFLASTMTGSLIQSLAAMVPIIFTVLLAEAMLRGNRFWSLGGNLPLFLYWPALIVLVVWLAWRNYRSTARGWRFWRQNLVPFIVVCLGSAGAAYAIHHRVWELAMPLEGPHGAARMAVAGQEVEFSGDNRTPMLLLPDGRVWVGRLEFVNGKYLLNLGADSGTGFYVGGGWKIGRANMFLPGSNWVSTAGGYNVTVTNVTAGSGSNQVVPPKAVPTNLFYEVVAIREDGTLWVAEKKFPMRPAQNWESEAGGGEPAALTQIGDESDWKSVVRKENHSLVLLKRDGTLWHLSAPPAAPGEKNGQWPGFRRLSPQRLGTDADWDRIISNNGRVMAWKRDGGAWLMFTPVERTPKPEVMLGSRLALQRVPQFDGLKLRKILQGSKFAAGVSEDGRLWVWPLTEPWVNNGFGSTVGPAIQVGNEHSWKEVTVSYGAMVALKGDGSLWEWQFDPLSLKSLATGRPRQLGTHKDWVALQGGWREDAEVVAADGSIWLWPDNADYNDSRLLRPSRKPALIGNIFADSN